MPAVMVDQIDGSSRLSPPPTSLLFADQNRSTAHLSVTPTYIYQYIMNCCITLLITNNLGYNYVYRLLYLLYDIQIGCIFTRHVCTTIIERSIQDLLIEGRYQLSRIYSNDSRYLSRPFSTGCLTSQRQCI